MPRSRKKDIREIANLVGNAAAHVALYPGQYKRVLEALTYFGQAAKVAEKRTWTEDEVARCRELSYREAASALRKKLSPARKREYPELLAKAEQELEDFLAEQMVR